VKDSFGMADRVFGVVVDIRVEGRKIDVMYPLPLASLVIQLLGPCSTARVSFTRIDPYKNF